MIYEIKRRFLSDREAKNCNGELYNVTEEVLGTSPNLTKIGSIELLFEKSC